MSVEFQGSGTAPKLTKLAEIPVGAEPVSVVIDPSGSSAFVLVRKEQKLVRIEHLADNPVKGAEVAVGSEPTGLAMTPLGHTVWVANWMDGTVSAVDASTMKVVKTVNLSETLAASGYLGKDIDGRPALSHPRSVAITNNGDMVEDDETMYVTEFYAQHKAPLAPDGSNADENKVGILYKIPLADPKPTPIELPPVDMGFVDHKGGKASCFPNQIQALTIQGGFGYAVSVCASPELPTNVYNGPAFAACTSDDTCPGPMPGRCASSKCTTNCAADTDCGVGGHCVAFVCAPSPVDIRTTTAPVVSIVDLGGSKTIASTNLGYEFEKLYAKNGTDDGGRRFPLHAQDLGFVPGTVTAYLPANGADAVFRVDFNASYDASTIDGVGDEKHEFINLIPAGVDPSHLGQLPTGIAIAYDGQVKLVDFGIAKTHDSGTQAGIFKGKFSYTAPEQLRGEGVDRRADVFTAGILLWELLTGHKLLAGDSPAQTIARLLNESMPTVRSIAPTVDPRLEAIAMRALERNPANRYQTAQEMRDAIEEYLAAAGQAVRPDQIARLVCDLFRTERARVQQAIKDELSSIVHASSNSRIVAAPRLVFNDDSVSLRAHGSLAVLHDDPEIEIANAPRDEAPPRDAKRKRIFYAVAAAFAVCVLAYATTRKGPAPLPAPQAPAEIHLAPVQPPVAPSPTPFPIVSASASAELVKPAVVTKPVHLKKNPASAPTPSSTATSAPAPAPPPPPPPAEPSAKEKRKFRVDL